MLDSIQQSVLQLIPSKRKTTQNGWISFNAVCCPHNGETRDTRGRGGVIINGSAISYSCFNCGYKANYIVGRHLNFKFRKLLTWLGADEATIRRLVIDAVRVKELVEPQSIEIQEQKVEFDERPLPDGSMSISEWASFIAVQSPDYVIPSQVVDAVDYIHNRGIDLNPITKKYEFYLTDTTAYNLHRRIIIPYLHEGKIVGYTARGLDGDIKPKYHASRPSDYVFNLDNQKKDWKFVIVCEGEFDAMSVDGVSVSGFDMSDAQLDQIDALGREVIVVPDFDIKTNPDTGKRSWAGRKLVDRAIEAGWSVSFPIWAETEKDINAAVVRYGKLFVLKSILDAKETTKLKIELKKKKYIGK